MHLPTRAYPLLALVLLLAVLPAPHLAAADDPFAARLDTQMPALLERYGVPGTVVSRISGGDVLWTRAYGLADERTVAAMQPDMYFEFGSTGKVLTAWGVMKLVEQGRVELDAPINRYLKRYQVASNEFDADQVTIRRLLSHTSGLNIHGYLNYSPRRARLPGLVEAISGPKLMEGLAETLETGRLSSGRLALVQPPGSGMKYSGNGFALLQMLIEDVSGEPFETYMRREITGPLGAGSLRWTWTPEMQANAPVPHGDEGQPIERRILAIQGIGSEVGTVEDFARFVAATVTGPNGTPAGRGVLRPETLREMITPQPESDGNFGLAYGTGTLNGHRAVAHSGANIGWMAYFHLDTVTREGFVVAAPSNRASSFHLAIFNLWLDAVYGPGLRTDWVPAPRLSVFSLLPLAAAVILAVALLVAGLRLIWQVRTGRRGWQGRVSARDLLPGLPWLAWLVFLWWTVYSRLPLYLPAGFPDFWPTPGSHALLAVLLGWVIYSGISAYAPRRAAAPSFNTTLREVSPSS